MKTLLQKWGKISLIGLFLIGAFAAGNYSSVGKNIQPQTRVLGVSTQITPSPTITPVPTTAPITIINNIIVPTQTPAPTQPVTPTATPVVIVVTPTPTAVVTLTSTPSPTPTPQPEADGPLAQTPIPQTVTVAIDYAGEHAASTYTTTITAGESAWQAVQSAVGLSNTTYTDYGGSLGIFITGFNGINAASNQYYDFQVNGVSSNVGVSSYVVQSGDILKFVLTSF